MAKYDLAKFVAPFVEEEEDPPSLVHQINAGHLAPVLHWLLTRRRPPLTPASQRFPPNDRTALHVALEAGRWEVASFLLLWCGRLLLEVDGQGRTALHLLAAAPSFSLSLLVSVLRRASAELLDVRDSCGEDAMDVAMRLGHGDFCTILRMFQHDHHAVAATASTNRSATSLNNMPDSHETTVPVMPPNGEDDSTVVTTNGKHKTKGKKRGLRKFLSRHYPPKLYNRWRHGASSVMARRRKEHEEYEEQGQGPEQKQEREKGQQKGDQATSTNEERDEEQHPSSGHDQRMGRLHGDSYHRSNHVDGNKSHGPIRVSSHDRGQGHDRAHSLTDPIRRLKVRDGQGVASSPSSPSPSLLSSSEGEGDSGVASI